MPRNYSMGGRAGAGGPTVARGEPLPQLPFRERFGALRNLPPFLRLVWHTSRALTLSTLLLRLVRALLPVATLFIGKLIIDEVVRLAGVPGPPATLGAWLGGGLLNRLGLLLAAELLASRRSFTE